MVTMHFPEADIPCLRSQLMTGGVISSTRHGVEQGKYKEGMIVSTQLGELLVTSAGTYTNVEDHPHFDDLVENYPDVREWDFPVIFDVLELIWLANN